MNASVRKWLPRRRQVFYVLRAWLLMTVWLASAARAWAAPAGQTLTPQEQAQHNAQGLLQRLTPQERVGQLFLVTFKGTDVGPDAQIYDLIANHYIGGVVLLAENDNFSLGAQSLPQIVALNRQLQLNRSNAGQKSRVDPADGSSFTPAFIPLFIGLAQEGDGYPFDQILNGLTPLPSAMALGATWNPDLAAQVGSVLGNELSHLGINLLLGPSLDVIDTPRWSTGGDQGSRSFGGDPFWVSEMGAAYIRGVHTGSQGQVAVIARHFPGHGSSDRLPEEEVATVRKSLEQLKTLDLAPFFAVTGAAASSEATADGLLVSHIRYQGLQGNIRTTTRPVSFDPQAFNLLMSLPALDQWHKAGGVMVSDNLGSRAVRRFYESSSQTFDAQRVTLNAFLTGNDLLYVADFSSSSSPDSYKNAVRILDFFAQKYREDTAFAQRVDEAVLRILTLKYRLYGDLTLDRVLPTARDLNLLGQSSGVTFEVARQAATLLSPSQAELDDFIPDPPNLNDRMVFITDARQARSCVKCPPQTLLEADALEQVVLRRYGPQAGGQVLANNLQSFTLDDLQKMLERTPSGTPLETALSRSNWIVFSMLDAGEQTSSFATLSRFLSDRPDLFQQKRLILLAFNAPYYLDATNISKLTAYYGLYSKAPQFVDVAAYLLFRELRPRGAAPVSVPGISYELNLALQPDPAQTFPLELDLERPLAVATRTAVATAVSSAVTPVPGEFRIGDVIAVRTGVIRDHNGNPVPDGTPVDFILTYGSEANMMRQTVVTSRGIARSAFSVTTSGLLTIHAESDPARSEALKFDIPSPAGEGSATPAEVVTQTPTPSPTLTPTPTPTPEPVSAAPLIRRLQFSDWVMTILTALAMAWSCYQLAVLGGQARWGLRTALLILIGGLVAYSYLGLQLPGSEWLLRRMPVSRGVFIATIMGCIAGLILALLWRLLETPPERSITTH